MAPHRRRLRRVALLAPVASLSLLAVPTAVSSAPATAAASADAQPRRDDLPNPLSDKQRALHQEGLAKVLGGNAVAAGKNKVVEVAKGQYVELAREGEDSILTFLGEFGNLVHPALGGTPGPLHNQIPEPDRSVDNTTIWAPDFDQQYYTDLLFDDTPGAISMRNFYIEQSSNRYTVNGDVADWAQVPYNEARYGANYCGGIVCATTWLFVQDLGTAWYNAQIAAGMTPAQVAAYLAGFDQWDRYDYDGDGDFDEPDGYIDHFQAVHAGEGEETGGGAQGSDAIWSHRWYAFFNQIGVTGPAFNKLGGVQIGASGFWIGDYTVEPENGGVGVFAHEFGHDLGLPDLYDTSGNVGGAENSTGFWTLYSSGSYGNSGVPADGLGTKPIHMSAYEKIFLGWSNYQVAVAGQKGSYKLGPAEFNTKQAQQLVVLLPDKQVSTVIGAPYAGSYFYHSGSGNELDTTMTRTVTLPAGAALSAKVRYDIETDWDYAYLTVDGAPVNTNLSTGTNPNGQNFGNGITGSTGVNWVDLTADLSAFGGQTVTLGWRYWTDGAVVGTGFGIDDIAITGQATDGAEVDPGWTYAGFSRTTGTTTQSFFNAYFAEYRTYKGYDDALRTGPYNFGFLNTLPDWVEHFPYQDGLLVWYYDTSFADNNVGDACAAGRCGGLVLPVDAHPDLLLRPDNGNVWRGRIQSYDATFGLQRTDRITLHVNGVAGDYGGLPAVSTFDDTKDWWVAPDPSIGHLGWIGVDVPKTGTIIQVRSVSARDSFMQVEVRPAK